MLDLDVLIDELEKIRDKTFPLAYETERKDIKVEVEDKAFKEQ